MKSGTIVYVGPFIMPDKNATAHRVLQNAKLFSLCGFNTVFIELRTGQYKTDEDMLRVANYDVYKVPYKGKKHRLKCEHEYINKVLDGISDAVAIVGYNMPFFVSSMLMHICRQRKLKYIVDCTEWYSAEHLPIHKRPFYAADTFLTMRLLNKMADGLIAVSQYLVNYYSHYLNVVLIPPLVDKAESIWKTKNRTDSSCCRFIFNGTLRAAKDDLLTCVEAIQSCNDASLEIYGVTKSEYVSFYQMGPNNLDEERIHFHGFVSHQESINALYDVDYLLLLRPASRKNNAGFSTKFVESISSGTAVVVTNTSDIKSIVDKFHCGFIVEYDKQAIISSVRKLSSIPKLHLTETCQNHFDYHNYYDLMNSFLRNL